MALKQSAEGNEGDELTNMSQRNSQDLSVLCEGHQESPGDRIWSRRREQE